MIIDAEYKREKNLIMVINFVMTNEKRDPREASPEMVAITDDKNTATNLRKMNFTVTIQKSSLQLQTTLRH